MSTPVAPGAVSPPPRRQSRFTKRGLRPPWARSHPQYNVNRVRKSGLTPQDYRVRSLGPGGSALSWDEIDLKRMYEANQCATCYGFTTAELRDTQSMPIYDRTMQDANLDNPIHPIFARDRWETRQSLPKHLALFQQQDGTDWVAENDQVWAILEPILVLATLFLTEAHSWVWWDALLAGDREDLDLQYFVQSTRDYTRTPHKFTRRTPLEAHQNKEALQNEFFRLAKTISWEIGHNRSHVENQMPYMAGQKPGYAAVMRSPLFDVINCRIVLNYQMLEPLLRTDLNVSQRLCKQFFVAHVVVHEMAHALWQVIDTRQENINVQWEPYFEDETRDELGASLWKSMAGCGFHELPELMDAGAVFSTTSNPPLATLRSSWPVTSSYSSSKTLPLDTDEEMRHNRMAPIPTQFFGNVWQRSFWNLHIRRGGLEGLTALLWGPQSILSQFTDDVVGSTRIYIAPDWTDMPYSADLTVVQKAMVGLQNRRRALARDVYRSLDDTLRVRIQADISARIAGMSSTRAEQNVGRSTDENTYDDDDSGSEYWSQNDSSNQPVARGPRHQMIRSWLIAHRAELYIDDLMRPRSENTLRDYCNRLSDSININRMEWRHFVMYASRQRDLFLWTKGGPGLLTFIPRGWGRIPPRRPPRSARSPEWVDFCISLQYIHQDFFSFFCAHGDVDSSLLLKCLNRSRWQRMSAVYLAIPYTDAVWNNILLDCERTQTCFIPIRSLGVIRYIGRIPGVTLQQLGIPPPTTFIPLNVVD